MGYSIDGLREMLTEWASWGVTTAGGPDEARRFMADFEREVRAAAIEEAAVIAGDDRHPFESWENVSAVPGIRIAAAIRAAGEGTP